MKFRREYDTLVAKKVPITIGYDEYRRVEIERQVEDWLLDQYWVHTINKMGRNITISLRNQKDTYVSGANMMQVAVKALKAR